MKEIIVVNENYIADYYKKKKMLNELKIETDLMAKNIKESLLVGRTPLGKTYGKYVASLVNVKRLNSRFIQMLKQTNREDRILETAHVKDCKDIIETFTEEDKEKYYDEWYKQLIVRKIP